MATVYVETSFVSACVTDRTDVASLYRRQVSLDWWSTQRPRHDVFISAEVIDELSDPDYPRRADALEFIKDLPQLAMTEDVRGLARLLVRERVMPAPVAGDAVHVAVATAWSMEYLLSWNVKHLANPNKLTHLRVICRRAGFAPPQIITPELLWET